MGSCPFYIFLLACLICYVGVPFEWNDEMSKYDICQFSILQDIPVHVVDLTESPVKKFKPSLSSHLPFWWDKKEKYAFPINSRCHARSCGKCNPRRLYSSYRGIAPFIDPIHMDFVKLICHSFSCAVKWKWQSSIFYPTEYTCSWFDSKPS